MFGDLTQSAHIYVYMDCGCDHNYEGLWVVYVLSCHRCLLFQQSSEGPLHMA